MWLFFAFIAVPLIEIALFIQVGGAIGQWPTLAIVVITAILGTYLVKQQGLQALQQVQTSFNQLKDPSEALAHGAMILFSGALLLTPGFFTDAVGFTLLVPAVRLAVFQWARSRIKVTDFQAHVKTHDHGGASDVIDVEYTDITDKSNDTGGPSGWTKH